MLSIGSWWSLRKKFKQTIPGVVTANYLSSVLNMQEASAAANIMPYLKQIGIVDQEGKTGERAKLWRDDHAYTDVCDAIIKDTYPQELLDIPLESDDDKEGVKRWFSRDTGAGEKAVNRVAAFYFLLCEKDLSKEPNSIKSKTKGDSPTLAKAPRKASTSKAPSNTVAKLTPSVDKVAQNHNPPIPPVPAININLQIHISSDASPEQIDKIFESMNKHIYSRDS